MTEPNVPQEAKELYNDILETANYFLREAKHAEIRFLSEYDDPTFEELASIMQDLGNILRVLISNIDDHLYSQAEDYVHLMRMMAVAIKNQNDVDLARLTADLDKKSFIPQ